jgi:hypothetical protein
LSIEALEPRVLLTVTTSINVVALDTVFNGQAYGGAAATILPVGNTSVVSFKYYDSSALLLTVPMSAPINAGTYQVVGHVDAVRPPGEIFYSITDLGDLGDRMSYPNSISDNSVVVGYFLPTDTTASAFQWTSGPAWLTLENCHGMT